MTVMTPAAPTTREQLIQEGLKAFCTVGFEGASLREIERSAGLSRGLVTHHFGTKDALWRECVNWLMSEFHEELARQQAYLADVSAHERARVLLKVYVRFVARHPEYTRLLVLSGDDDSERVQWMIDTWIGPNQAFFDRVTNKGPAKERRLDAMTVSAFMGAASLFFMLPIPMRRLYGIDTSDPDLVEQFADLLVDWVGYDPPDDAGRVDSALRRTARSTVGTRRRQVRR